MDQLFQELTDRGCRVDEALRRFMNNEALYIQCYRQLMDGEEFENLECWLEQGDVEKCLKILHTLKGVLSNMGLIPLQQKILKLQEMLQKGSAQGEILSEYQELLKMKRLYADLGNNGK